MSESQSQKIVNGISTALRFISLGKYRSKLYRKGESKYSTPAGGVVTLLSATIFIMLAWGIVADTLGKESYQVDEDALSLEEAGLLNLKIGDMLSSSLFQPSFLADVSYLANFDCQTISLDLVYNSSSMNRSFSFARHDDRYCVISLSIDNNSSFVDAIETIRDEPALIPTPLGVTFGLGFLINGLQQGVMVSQWVNSDIVIKSGKIRSAKLTSISRESTFNAFSASLSTYATTDGILGVENHWLGISDDYSRELIVSDVSSLSSSRIPAIGLSSFYFFLINPLVRSYKRHPQSILTCLAKVGGLFALFKLGMLLHLVHEYLFERQLEKRYGKQEQLAINGDDEKGYRDVFSFETFHSLYKNQ